MTEYDDVAVRQLIEKVTVERFIALTIALWSACSSMVGEQWHFFLPYWIRLIHRHFISLKPLTGTAAARDSGYFGKGEYQYFNR